MNENGWQTAQLSEIRPFDEVPADLQGWLPVRHRLGIEAFGVNAWVGREAGDEIIEEHDELNEDAADNHEELYLVVDGHATFTVDGQEVDAPRGTLVRVEPSIVRHAVACEPGTTVFAIGATPGRAFTPSPWEQRHIDRAAV
ncbi:MAG TPA: cupin domain-containing protein [Thermoleophilaceae bacterium]|nr:cupin domain-containing protein [Thermoleophilaceae bacterium]